MFKYDLNIKNMNIYSYLEAQNWWKWSKLWKVKMLTFLLWKVKLWLKSQTLIDLIFKCDLNFRELNADLCSGGQN